MNKAVLIIGSETLLGRKLIEVYLNSGWKVIAPIMTSQETMKESKKKNLLVIPWNRSSLISTKTVFREAVRVFGDLNKAIIVNPEPTSAPALEDTETEVMDEILNTYIHGTLYLIREILNFFNSREAGTLAFAETEKGLTPTTVLPAIISAAFHNTAEGILLSKFEGLKRCGFTSRLTEMEDYAQFIKRILESEDPKINGEWLQYSEKKNIFQSLPILKRK
jgi:hypothetical protein